MSSSEEDVDPSDLERMNISKINVMQVQDGEEIGSPEAYDHKSSPRGAIIIANYKIFKDKPHKERKGSEKNVEHLKQLFSQIGYRIVEVLKDGDKDKTLAALQKFRKRLIEDPDLKDVDSMAVVVMSHGYNNTFYTEDWKPMTSQQVYQLFSDTNFPAFSKKPKLFVFNHCREKDPDNPYGSPQQHQEISDCTVSNTKVLHSTKEMDSSYRDEEFGSIYIIETCKAFMDHAWEHELGHLNKIVQNGLDQYSRNKKQQCDLEEIESKVKFYFNPKCDECNNDNGSANLCSGEHLYSKRSQRKDGKSDETPPKDGKSDETQLERSWRKDGRSDETPPKRSLKKYGKSDETPPKDGKSDETQPKGSRRKDGKSDETPPKRSWKKDGKSDETPPKDGKSDETQPKGSWRKDGRSDETPPKEHGSLLLINNLNEDNFDMDKLKRLFEDLGYINVEGPFSNTNCMDLKKIINNFKNTHGEKAFIIFYGDGFGDFIVTSDEYAIHIKELQKEFNDINCPNLKSKPKIFITNLRYFGGNIKNGDKYISKPNHKELEEGFESHMFFLNVEMKGKRREYGYLLTEALSQVLIENKLPTQLKEIMCSVSKKMEELQGNDKKDYICKLREIRFPLDFVISPIKAQENLSLLHVEYAAENPGSQVVEIFEGHADTSRQHGCRSRRIRGPSRRYASKADPKIETELLETSKLPPRVPPDDSEMEWDIASDVIHRAPGNKMRISPLHGAVELGEEEIKAEPLKIFIDQIPYYKERCKSCVKSSNLDFLTGTKSLKDIKLWFTENIIVKAEKNKNTHIKYTDIMKLVSEDGILLLDGESGIGKTATIQFGQSDWAEGGLVMNSSQYDYIFPMSFQNPLLNSVVDLVKDLIPEMIAIKANEEIMNCITHPRLNILFMCDGFDFGNAKSHRLFNEIASLKQKYKHIKVIITCRPEAVQELYHNYGIKLNIEHLKILGIHASLREDFLTKYHDECIKADLSTQSTEDLLNFYKSCSARFQELFRLPLNLFILVWLWARAPEKVKTIKSTVGLYTAIIDINEDNLIHRLLTYPDMMINLSGIDQLYKMINMFKEVLFTESLLALCSDRIYINDIGVKRLRDVCRNTGLPFQELIGAYCLSNLERIPHKLFLDFYAAKCIESKIIHEGKKVKDILLELYDGNLSRKYQNVLLLLGGILALRDQLELEAHFVDIINLLIDSGISHNAQWFEVFQEFSVNPTAEDVSGKLIAPHLDTNTNVHSSLLKYVDISK